MNPCCFYSNSVPTLTAVCIFRGTDLKPVIWRFISRSLHKERDGVSNHQPRDCLLNRLFRHTWKNPLKLCVTGLCEGNSPVTGEFPSQRASDAENVSIWWRYHNIEAFSALLTFCDGNPPAVCGFHSHTSRNAEMYFCWHEHAVIHSWVAGNFLNNDTQMTSLYQ